MKSLLLTLLFILNFSSLQALSLSDEAFDALIKESVVQGLPVVDYGPGLREVETTLVMLFSNVLAHEVVKDGGRYIYKYEVKGRFVDDFGNRGTMVCIAQIIDLAWGAMASAANCEIDEWDDEKLYEL